jgi:RNA polymerase sigma-70 factor (ECF subfamily)
MIDQRTDEELVAAYLPELTSGQAGLAGEPVAFEQLVERYQARLVRFAYDKVKNYHDAEEVVQEAWAKVWKRLPDFDDTHKFSSLLYKICHDECYNKLRERGRNRFANFSALPDDVEKLRPGPFKEMVEGLLSRDRILAVLNRAERRLYELVVTKGCPYEAIGQTEKIFRDKTEEQLRDKFGEVMDKVLAQRQKEIAKWKGKSGIRDT